jgi:hypothetical protein
MLYIISWHPPMFMLARLRETLTRKAGYLPREADEAVHVMSGDYPRSSGVTAGVPPGIEANSS